MIDTAFVEQRMRDVNPVPGIDHIDTEELSQAIAAADTARAAIMQASTQHEATEPHPAAARLPGSRRAWAFAAAFAFIVATIGIAALALRGDNLLVMDEPVTPTTPEVATPIPDASEIAPIAASGEWERIEIDESWVASTIDVAPLPEGGFVVAATDDWSVLWSPDGIEWRDADAERQVAVLPLTPVFNGSRPQVVAAIGDQVTLRRQYVDQTPNQIRLHLNR